MSVPRTTNKARPTEVTRDDVRYATFVQKRFNKRFPGTPEAFRLVDSTEQVVEALEEIVKTNRRLAVRSGGHCLDGLVSDPAVQVVIDTSLMSSVCYDEKIGAFAIEAGRLSERFTESSSSVGARCCPPVKVRTSASAGMCSGALSASCTASTVSPWIVSTPSRSSSWTQPAKRAASSRRASRRTRIASCGGRTPAAAAAISAL